MNISQQTKEILVNVCQEARKTFPEDFMGKTDREVIQEIVESIRRAQRAGLLEVDLYD